MADLYEVVGGYLPAAAIVNSSSSSFTAATTPTPVSIFPPPTIVTTPTIPTSSSSLNVNNQILDDWDMANFGFDCQTIVGSSSSFANDTFSSTIVTTSPAIPASLNFNNQSMGDHWDDMTQYAVVNHGFPPHTINNHLLAAAASSSSSSISSSSSSSSFATTTTTLGIPLNSGETLDDAIDLDLYEIVNGFSPSINVASTTTYIPTSFNNSDVNYKWINMQQHCSSATTTILNTPINFTTPPATITPIADVAAVGDDDVHYHQPNSTYNSQTGKRLNLYQPMNETNIRHLLQNSNNPLNFPKRQKAPSLSTHNWPILSLPGLGRIPDPPSTPKQHTNEPLEQGKQVVDILKSTNTTYAPASTSSKSKEWKKEKRVYKMPRHGLNTEMYTWRFYGEKLIDGSPNPRKYYKCNFKDCTAKRHVKVDDSDPNMVIMKYSGRHNHIMPMFKSDVCVTSSETVSSTSTVFLKNEDDIDNIFDGLEKIVDL